MAAIEPRTVTAGQREAGTLCVHCGHEIALGDATATCRECGAVHHGPCWEAIRGCSSYECAHTAKTPDGTAQATMKVTLEELAAAQPLPTRPAEQTEHAQEPARRGPRWNRTAVAAFIVALLGIPLFGLVTGLVAIVIGCVALAGHSHGRRGVALAVLAIVIGLFDVVGWAIGLSSYLGGGRAMVALDELTLDPESLNELPARISRAMRANVIIQSAAGLGRNAIGSGVILKVRDGVAHIVTNRHTVDLSYTGASRAAPPDLNALATVHVITVGQSQVPVPARVEWVAPHGVDLAIISAPVIADEAQEAHWDLNVVPHIGDEVFAVGNPHGLGWTHSAGDISQVRRRMHGDYTLRIIQTTAAINPGNSGGGLYDAEGRLIGINTLTGDKRFAEGLGFSISLPTLMELIPERFELPRQNPSTD